MAFSTRTVLLLALGAAALLLALFIVKAAVVLASIVAAVFAALYLFNFVRALSQRLAVRAETAPRALPPT